MLLKGLIELLARCTVMRLQEDSQVFFLQREDGEFFLATEYEPGLVSVWPVSFDDFKTTLPFERICSLREEVGNG